MKIIINFLNIVLVLFMILVISINIFSNQFKDGLFGYLYLQIITESMDAKPTQYQIDTLKVDEFILVEINDYDEFFEKLEIGDVITFKMNQGSYKELVVTHRITEIKYFEEYDYYKIITKGDKNNSTETLYSNQDIIYGQVVYSSILIGNIFNIITNKYFLVIIIVIPCLIIALYEVVTLYEMYKRKGGEVKPN